MDAFLLFPLLLGSCGLLGVIAILSNFAGYMEGVDTARKIYEKDWEKP